MTRSRNGRGPGRWPGARGRRGGAGLSLLVLFACDALGPIDRRPGFAIGDVYIREFRPSATHVMWWQEVEECSGRTRDIDEVRFYAVLAPLTSSRQQFPCFSEDRLCTGVYDGDIFIAAGMLESERTVKHEILHALGEVEHGLVFLRCT